MAFLLVLGGFTALCVPWTYLKCLLLNLDAANIKIMVYAKIIFNRNLTKKLLIWFGQVILLTLKLTASGLIYALSWIFFPGKLLAGNLAPQHDVNLTITSFKKAYRCRDIKYGLIFHSDRGAEYTASSFRKLLDSCNVVQSFSKKGYPFDNACCESFFKYLKKNLTNRKIYHSMQELRLELFDYIESIYNNKLPHGSIGYLTPNQKEANYLAQQS